MDELEMALAMARWLANYPELVSVDVDDQGDTRLLTVRCHPEDNGFLLGHSGTTAAAMRTILKSGCKKRGVKILFDVDVRDA